MIFEILYLFPIKTRAPIGHSSRIIYARRNLNDRKKIDVALRVYIYFVLLFIVKNNRNMIDMH